MDLLTKWPTTGLPDDLTNLDPTTTGLLVGKTKDMQKILGDLVDKVEEIKLNIEFETDEAIKLIELSEEYDNIGTFFSARQEALREVCDEYSRNMMKEAKDDSNFLRNKCVQSQI